MKATNRQKIKLQQIPPSILTPQDYETQAKEFIDHDIFEYISGGSGTEQTLRENAQAFAKVSLHNRVLRNFQKGGTQISLLGKAFRHPILLAPVAYQKLVHAQGELATAQAAEAMESCMISSTLSSYSLEDIAQTTSAPKWFQLYWQPKMEDSLALVERAERAGYEAIVITLDAPIQSMSNRAKRAGFSMPDDVFAVNLSQFTQPKQVSLSTEQSIIFQGLMSEAPSWADIEWLRKKTRLPIIAKGIMNPEDALQLQKLGISGIVVSNHGGRALDGSPSTASVLPTIRGVVGPDFLLLADSGVRSGYDIFKALALGANAVCIGRLQMYALAVAGALGVAHMLKLLRDELEYCMALSGCPTIASISKAAIRPTHFTNDEQRC